MVARGNKVIFVLEKIEYSDWAQMHKDWEEVKSGVELMRKEVDDARLGLKKFERDKLEGKISSYDSPASLVGSKLNKLNDVIKLADTVTRRLIHFRRYDNDLRNRAEQIYATIKQIPGRGGQKLILNGPIPVRGGQKLHELLARDEQYAIQLGKNVKVFITSLIKRVRFLQAHALQIIQTAKTTGGTPKKGFNLQLGIPPEVQFQIQFVEEELRELEQYLITIENRVLSFNNVIWSLRERIVEALKATGAYS